MYLIFDHEDLYNKDQNGRSMNLFDHHDKNKKTNLFEQFYWENKDWSIWCLIAAKYLEDIEIN